MNKPVSLLRAFVCATAILVLPAITRAQTSPVEITFDELPAGMIQSGYAGLQWENFGVLNASTMATSSGYRVGMISSNNVAYNQFGAPVTISRVAGFTLHSAYLTTALDQRAGFGLMHVRARGLVGTNIAYDQTFTISNTAPVLLTLNYVGVDRVIFVSSPDSPFAIDNLKVTVPPPDVSCTYAVSPRSGSHGLGAETGSINVTTSGGCDWSVVNTNAWVTILSSTNNSGSETVTYQVAADTAMTSRKGFIQVAGQNFEVRQGFPAGDTRVLTFEELLPGFVSEEYGGLQWHNFAVLDGTMMPLNSGYHKGVVSADNVAFNLYGDTAAISRNLPFTLNSVYMTAAINVPNFTTNVRVQGFKKSALIYDNLFTVNNNAPAFLSLNYTEVDEVRFVPSQHSTWFALDDVSVIVPPDTDGDGVRDFEDNCPGTAQGAIVNEHGCSIEQLVPCAGPVGGQRWKNHGEFVTAMQQTVNAFLLANLISEDEALALLDAASKSDCGKKR